ncbi:MAG: sulfite exporter TauE/SafE family protein [Phycisphaerae bacterium]|nr:sulfite exporter TauE/SafE family protein [Phycisphaerae bacterium]
MGHEQLLLLTIGLVAGVVGGLLGVGGSIIMIPAMTLLLGPSQHLYQGAAMMVNFFVVLPAFYHHRKIKAVLEPIVKPMVPFAAIGVVIGVWLSCGEWFRGDRQIYLTKVFGCFLVYEVGYNLYRLLSNRRLPEMDEAAAKGLPAWKVALAVGLPTGLVGGLLGVGGGVVAVPLQQLILRVPLNRAIANSAATIIPLSVIGATFKNLENAAAGVPFRSALHLALLLAPTAILGGYLGARLTHVVPRRALRIAFIVFMSYAAVMLIRK